MVNLTVNLTTGKGGWEEKWRFWLRYNPFEVVMEQTIKNSHGTERWWEKVFVNNQTKVNVNDRYLR